MKNKRYGNFELLRIISMLMIIMHHYSLHGNLINMPGITMNRIIGEFFLIGGKLGVIVFVFISGYFMVESKFKIRKLLKMYFEIVFYSFSIEMIFIVLKIKEISLINLIKSIMPISNEIYWFLTAYFGMYIFSPVINKLIKSMNKEEFKKILVLCTVFFSVIPTFTTKNIFTSNVGYFIYLYMLAAYVKIYGISFFEMKKNVIILIIVIVFILMSVSIISTIISEMFNIEIAKKGITYLCNINSILILILALSIFYIFKNMSINCNYTITILASNSLAVYLIHDNYNVRDVLWSDLLNVEKIYYINWVYLLLHIIFSTLIIYCFCVFIESIRKFLFNKITINNKFIGNYLDKIDNYFNI